MIDVKKMTSEELAIVLLSALMQLPEVGDCPMELTGRVQYATIGETVRSIRDGHFISVHRRYIERIIELLQSEATL